MLSFNINYQFGDKDATDSTAGAFIATPFPCFASKTTLPLWENHRLYYTLTHWGHKFIHSTSTDDWFTEHLLWAHLKLGTH